MLVPWTVRVIKEFQAGTLKVFWRDVLLMLKTFRGREGLICPSHETLAERCGCSVRTVQRALKQAKALGLVWWSERRVRSTWRWVRTSNQYWLTTPEGPVQPEMRPVWPTRTTGQNGRVDSEVSKKEAHKVQLGRMLREAAEQPDLLTLRRVASEARLRAQWQAKRGLTPV